MERVGEDLATSLAKWKRLFSCRQRPCGGGDSIAFSLQRSNLGRFGKRVSIISSIVRVVPPSQTCLCVEFAPVPMCRLK